MLLGTAKKKTHTAGWFKFDLIYTVKYLETVPLERFSLFASQKK